MTALQDTPTSRRMARPLASWTYSDLAEEMERVAKTAAPASPEYYDGMDALRALAAAVFEIDLKEAIQ